MRNRASVKRRLRELADHAFSDPVLLVDPDPEVDDDEGRSELVVVRYTWDGGVVNVPTFFLGVTDGRSEAVSIPDQTKQRTDDAFTVEGYMAVPGFVPTDDGGAAAEEAAERCLNTFETVLRGCRKGSLAHDDVPSAMDPDEFRTQTVQITNVDGPYHGFPDAQSASISGGVTFTVECLNPAL